MRDRIVTENITLDGVIDATEGWFDPAGGEDDVSDVETALRKQREAADALLLGRVTYEGFSAAWPERSGPFADKMNSMPKHVISTTLEDPAWNNTSVMRDVREVAGLKKQEGGPIVLAGSRTLVHGLMEHGLVDEFRLMIFPVVLGSGARVFPETPDKTELELVDTQVFASGVVVHTYRTQGSPA